MTFEMNALIPSGVAGYMIQTEGAHTTKKILMPLNRAKCIGRMMKGIQSTICCAEHSCCAHAQTVCFFHICLTDNPL